MCGFSFGLWQDLIELKREIKDGMYSPVSYVVANAILQVVRVHCTNNLSADLTTLYSLDENVELDHDYLDSMQVPFMVLLALFALGTGVYGVANYWGPEFGIMVVVYMVTLWTFESIAQFLSALFHNPLLGMLVFICVW